MKMQSVIERNKKRKYMLYSVKVRKCSLTKRKKECINFLNYSISVRHCKGYFVSISSCIYYKNVWGRGCYPHFTVRYKHLCNLPRSLQLRSWSQNLNSFWAFVSLHPCFLKVCYRAKRIEMKQIFKNTNFIFYILTN